MASEKWVLAANGGYRQCSVALIMPTPDVRRPDACRAMLWPLELETVREDLVAKKCRACLLLWPFCVPVNVSSYSPRLQRVQVALLLKLAERTPVASREV
jgi:hypothetical protein